MNIKFFFLFTLVTLLNSFGWAQTGPLRCEAAFAPSLAENLVSFDVQFKKIFPDQPDLTELSGSLSWYKKRKLRSLLNEFEIKSIPSEAALERKILEISDALMGSRAKLDRWIFKNADQRELEIISGSFREALIRKGLIEAWRMNYDASAVSAMAKASDKATIFFESKIFDLSLLPWKLPRVQNHKFPQELLVKVLRDGTDPHITEIQKFLKTQSKVDAYQTFKKLYSPVVMGTALLIKVYVAYEIIEKENDRQVSEVLNNLQRHQEEVPKAINEAKAQIFNQALNDALIEFRQKWGENPTPDEEVKIKRKIAIGLGLEH